MSEDLLDTTPRPAKRVPDLKTITIIDVPADLNKALTDLARERNVPKNQLCLSMLKDGLTRYLNPLT
jgi:hypothetical protein